MFPATGRAAVRRIAILSTIATGRNLSSSSVIGTHTAVARMLDVPSFATSGVPTSRASAVMPSNPVSPAPTNARQPIVRTGPATNINSASVQSCAARSTVNACIPAVFVMRGSDASTASPEIASATVETRFITRARVADDADRAANDNATFSAIPAPTMAMIVASRKAPRNKARKTGKGEGLSVDMGTYDLGRFWLFLANAIFR